MKAFLSFLIAGMLLLGTESLSAGGRGGRARSGFSSSPFSGHARPMARSQQPSSLRTAPAPRHQNQANSSDSDVASLRQNRHQWHDRDWWRRHFRTVVFVGSGYYYSDGGYWYPAFGYDPNSFYDYDGPIYTYGNLLPDQVIAKVQIQLNNNGYYFGPINGSMDSDTQAAIASYQHDRNLPVTATVDQATVESLGLG